MKNTIQTHSFIAGVVKGYFQKLLYTQSASTLFHSYKRLLAPLTCDRFISNASLVVSSCPTSAPVGTEILYWLPVQSRSWSYANFLSPSIIKNFFFLQKKRFNFYLVKGNMSCGEFWLNDHSFILILSTFYFLYNLNLFLTMYFFI